MINTAYLTDKVFLDHFPGEYHPERPQRWEAINEAVKNLPFYKTLEKPALPDIPRELLYHIHSNKMVDYILSLDGKSKMIDPDTVVSPGSVKAALKAAGAAKMAVDLIFCEKNVSRVFAAVRPPGHHATYNNSMGFCLFNNVALATDYAIRSGFAKQVLIVDWDVHHGNGTQDIFYRRNDVFYLSIHQWPLFPGSGDSSERGNGPGEGFTINRPFSPGKSDEDYLNVLEESLSYIEKKFIPDLVIISAGFDAHFSDPIGGMKVTEKGFSDMTGSVVSFAEKHCGGKIISMLEGGYHLQGLAQSVQSHLYKLTEFNREQE